MIEKIDQIRDLLIVPSVDEQPKIAINQMKILNLLVELRTEVEQCNIANVVGQSEQLKCDCCEYEYDTLIINTDGKMYCTDCAD